MASSKDYKYSRFNTKGLFVYFVLLGIVAVCIIMVVRAEPKDLPGMLETITSALLVAFDSIKSNCRLLALLLAVALSISITLLKRNERTNERRFLRLTKERDRLQNKLMSRVSKDTPYAK